MMKFMAMMLVLMVVLVISDDSGSVCWLALVPSMGLHWFHLLACVGSVCWFALVPSEREREREREGH